MVDPSAARSLSSLRPGVEARVLEAGPAVAAWVDDAGIVTGTILSVERRIPLGGPLIVRLGTTRVALARRLADGITVMVADGRPGSGTGR